MQRDDSGGTRAMIRMRTDCCGEDHGADEEGRSLVVTGSDQRRAALKGARISSNNTKISV